MPANQQSIYNILLNVKGAQRAMQQITGVNSKLGQLAEQYRVIGLGRGVPKGMTRPMSARIRAGREFAQAGGVNEKTGRYNLGAFPVQGMKGGTQWYGTKGGGQLTGAAEVEAISKYTKAYTPLMENIKKTSSATGNLNEKNQSLIGGMRSMASRAAKVIPAWIVLRGLYMKVSQTITDLIKTFVDFEQEMARVGTVTGDVAGDNTDDLNMLKEAALDYSASASQGFKEAATAMYTLGSAGLNVNEQMAGFSHVMDLAIGTMSDVEQMGKLVAGAYNVFGDSIEGAVTASGKMKKISDVLAYTYSNHQVELEEIANAYTYVGSVASLVDIEFTELTSTIGFLNTNMLKGCVSEDTEILTDQGWKYFKDLDKTEKVATLNLSNHNLEYQKPERYIKYHYDGEMFHQKNSHLDFLLTPNHRVLHRKGRKDNNDPYQFTLAENIKESNYVLIDKDGNKEIQYKNANEWTDYNGNVYCVEVPNSTLFIRRNGKTVWTGNSKAGTSLMNSFVKLASSSEKLSDIGVIFDPSKPLDFLDIMGQLSNIYGESALSMQSLRELMDVFGRRGGRAAAIMIARFEDWKKAIGDTKAEFEDFASVMKEEVEETLPKAWAKYWNNVKASIGKTLRDVGLTKALERTNLKTELSNLAENYGEVFGEEFINKMTEVMSKDVANVYGGMQGFGISIGSLNKEDVRRAKELRDILKDQASLQEVFNEAKRNLKHQNEDVKSLEEEIRRDLGLELDFVDEIEKLTKKIKKEKLDENKAYALATELAFKIWGVHKLDADLQHQVVKQLLNRVELKKQELSLTDKEDIKAKEALQDIKREYEFKKQSALVGKDSLETELQLNYQLEKINEKIREQNKKNLDDSKKDNNLVYNKINELQPQDIANTDRLLEVLKSVGRVQDKEINELLKTELSLREENLDKVREYMDVMRSGLQENLVDMFKGEQGLSDVFKNMSQEFRNTMIEAYSKGLSRNIMKSTGLDKFFGGMASEIETAHDRGGKLVAKHILGAFGKTTDGGYTTGLTGAVAAGGYGGYNLPGFGEGGFMNRPLWGDPQGTFNKSWIGSGGGINVQRGKYPGGYSKMAGKGGPTGGQLLGFGYSTAMATQAGGGLGTAGGIMGGLGAAGMGMASLGFMGAGTASAYGLGAFLGPVGLALSIGGMIASALQEPPEWTKTQENESTKQITSKIDVTNSELNWVNRNLVAMRNELTYIMQRSYYFREREPNEDFAIDAGRGGAV